jgi:hypothetical protein
MLGVAWRQRWAKRNTRSPSQRGVKKVAACVQRQFRRLQLLSYEVKSDAHSCISGTSTPIHPRWRFRSPSFWRLKCSRQRACCASISESLCRNKNGESFPSHHCQKGGGKVVHPTHRYPINTTAAIGWKGECNTRWGSPKGSYTQRRCSQVRITGHAGRMLHRPRAEVPCLEVGVNVNTSTSDRR